jgi:hypothetical protein
MGQPPMVLSLAHRWQIIVIAPVRGQYYPVDDKSPAGPFIEAGLAP